MLRQKKERLQYVIDRLELQLKLREKELHRVLCKRSYSSSSNMPNKWTKVVSAVCKYGWKKLVNPTVDLHKTAFPKSPADLENLGVRFDFAGTILKDGKKYHRFQVQVNAGNKIPKSWKEWRERNPKGTHGIVATVEIPDGGTKDDVQHALNQVNDQID
ncbi:hypothetical protein DV735_g5567, partial [Chaetothyriales sp. CBS 134920]